MHVRKILIASLAVMLLLSSTSYGRPLQGFNEGPFLYPLFGVIQADFDRDQYDNSKIGRDFEPVFGLIFGWNITDWISAELLGRYGTNINSGRREHIAGGDIHSRYFLILDSFTNFKSLKIMPTIKGGLAFRIASLPGNTNSSDSAITTFGWGPSTGVGINFLIKKYISFGLEVQEDFLFFDETRQSITVNGNEFSNVLIYPGGFKPQFNAVFFIGVHY